jgi:hypothetical protein
MATETTKPTPESTGDPKAATRAEVQAKREQRREERRAAKADKAAAKEAKAARAAESASAGSTSAKASGAKESGGKSLPSLKGGVDSVRTLVGQVVWIVAVVCALFLAVGALTIALDANERNALVDFVQSGAETVSLGVFSIEKGEGIFSFVGVNSDVKNALTNYGIGAVAYLVVGRILDRLIRP